MSSVKEFWMVLGIGKGPPTARHETREAAQEEAQRLAKASAGITFVTLRVEDAYMAPVVVSPVAVERKENAQEVKPQTEDDGWIKWDGGERPVADDATVLVRFREGSAIQPRCPAGCYRWEHFGWPDDITAYKVVTA